MPKSDVIALDLSRLLSRAGKRTATGIDRVELAYAEHLLDTDPDASFAALGPLGGIGLLRRQRAASFVAETAAAWRGEPGPSERTHRMALHARCLRAGLLGGEARLAARLRRGTGKPVYLLVSHHHLEMRGAIARLKERSTARFICLIHDLIPIHYPEYAGSGQRDRHLRRVETAITLADALIVNSASTRDALAPHIERIGSKPPVLVAPFGTDLPKLPDGGELPIDRPYFVYVSTIEARKNHVLLLNLWRALAEELGDRAPLLYLIGQRGWEIENVVDMLERSPALREVVIECNALPDIPMVRLLRGARALLLPSFAEGFGFPERRGKGPGVPFDDAPSG